jgi:hypothetical protein
MTQQVVLLLPAKVAEFRRRALYEQWATTIRSAAPESEWRSPDWKAELRRELDTAGEGQVRAELRGLSTGAEDRRLFIVDGFRRRKRPGKLVKLGFTGGRSCLRAWRS